MSTLALPAVQQALYSKLTGDGVLMGMITGVYDVVPERTTLPYVIIGNGSVSVEDSLESNTSRCQFTIDVWTDAVGRKNALTMMDRIYGLLHQGTISPSGLTLVLMRCLEAETNLEETATHVYGTLVVEIIVR